MSYFLPFNPIYAYRYGWALNFLSIHGSSFSQFWKEPHGEATHLLDPLTLEKLTRQFRGVITFLNGSSRSGPFYAGETKFTGLATKSCPIRYGWRSWNVQVRYLYLCFLQVLILLDGNNIDLHSLNPWWPYLGPRSASKASRIKALATFLETDPLPLVKLFKYCGQKRKIRLNRLPIQ